MLNKMIGFATALVLPALAGLPTSLGPSNPAHVSLFNLFGAIPRGEVRDREGLTLALVSRVNATRYESDDAVYVIATIQNDLNQISVSTKKSPEESAFLCELRTDIVPIQPDGTRNSFECSPAIDGGFIF